MKHLSAVPLPFYNGLLWWVWQGRYVCECGARFWIESSYERHWLIAHGEECGLCIDAGHQG